MHPQCEKCEYSKNNPCPGSDIRKDFGEDCLEYVEKIIMIESEDENVVKEKNGQNLKSTNPKDIIGSDKMPLHLFPSTALVYGTLALLEGCLKYGRANWRSAGVRASIYYDACLRHMTKWFEGEDLDEDSGLPHLGHALACIVIIIDALEANKLKDDRMIKGGYLPCLKKFTKEIKGLKEKYKDKNPKHFTIEDNKEDRPNIIKGV